MNFATADDIVFDPPTATKVLIFKSEPPTEASAREHRTRHALESATIEKLLTAIGDVFRHQRSINTGGIVIRPDGSSNAPHRNMAVAMVIGGELTRRGVAPIFRRLPWYCGPQSEHERPWWVDMESDSLALMLDAQWIKARYPNHRATWERASGILKSDRAESAARFLLNDGKREAGQIVKALGLSEDQQMELAFAHSIRVNRIKASVWERLPVAFARIERTVRERDCRAESETLTTIRRQQRVWLAAELARKAPTRTSELCSMQPDGETLPRNLIAKLISKLPRTTLAASEPLADLIAHSRRHKTLVSITPRPGWARKS